MIDEFHKVMEGKSKKKRKEKSRQKQIDKIEKKEAREKSSEREEEVNEVTKKDEIYEKKEKSKKVKVTLTFLTIFLAILSFGAKFFLIIFDILVPRALREYVPFLNMIRKSTLPLSEIMAGKKSKEISEVSNEIEEIQLRQQKALKAYPIRRGIGQALSMGISPIILIAIPTAIWGETLIQIIKPYFSSFIPDNVLNILIPILLGTVMLIISWIATVFGPIYIVFHKSSKTLVKMGAYRWAALYQDLGNFFALPYFAAKSSFSFFDAPPISSETFEDFKLDIMDEVETIKTKVSDLLALDVKHVSERSKKMLEDLLKKIDIPLEKFDLTKITDETSRAFALLIWSKEASLFPWRRDEALEEFAKNNNLTVEESEQILTKIMNKVKRKEISDYMFKSLLLTGALKGIAKQEKKYKQIMSDIEYNKLALALALGTEQYLEDIYTPMNKTLKVLKQIGISLLAILLPYILILYALVLCLKHILFSFFKTIFSKKTIQLPKLMVKRYKEIKTTIFDTYESVKMKGKKFNLKKDLDIDLKKFFKILGKIFLKLILFIPLLIWSLIKSIYKRFQKLMERRKLENKQKRRFEKELATESLVSMYQEIYDKVIKSNIVLV